MTATRTVQPKMEQAWDLVAAGFFMVMLSSGLRFAIGPFVDPMLEDFGFSRTYLSTLVAISMFLYGITTAGAGRLTDRYGTKAVVIGGSLILAVTLCILGWTRSPLVFAVTFSVLTSIGYGATNHVVYNPLLAQWFQKKRGLALSIMSAASMGGIALVTPLSSLSLMWIGWRGTYLALGLLFLLVITPVLYFVLPSQRPSMHTTQGTGTTAAASANYRWQAAFATAPFWKMAMALFACGFSMNLLGTHGVPMLQEHGFSPVKAAFAIGLIGFVSIFSAPMIGWASDRWGRTMFLALIYLVRGMGFVTLLYISQDWQLFAVAVAGGLAWAGNLALTTALTAEFYGVQNTGTLFGIMFLGHQVGAAAGSFLGGWSFETLGHYYLPFLVAGVMLILGAVFSLRLPLTPGIIIGTRGPTPAPGETPAQ